MNFLKIIFVVAVSLMTLSLSAAQTASIGKATSAPVIDGNPDDPCWKYTQELTGMTIPVRLVYAKEQTSLRLCYDRQKLYGFVRCFQKNTSKMPVGSKMHDDLMFWKGNCVEMFFLAKRPKLESDFNLKQISFNAEGTVFDGHFVKINGESKGSNEAWESGIRLVAKKHSDHWDVEFSVPWKNIGMTPETGNSFIFNFIRSNPANREQSSWSRLETYSWHQPIMFGEVKILNQVNGFVFKELPLLNPASKFCLKIESQPDVQSILKLDVCKHPVKFKKKNGNIIEFSYRVPSKTKEPSYCRLTVSNGKEQLYSFIYQPVEEYIYVSINNLVNDKKLFLSGFTPALVTWNSRHSFPVTGAPGGKVKNDFEIIYELPPNIFPISRQGRAIQKLGVITINRKKYNRYSEKFSHAYNGIGWFSSFLKTTLPAGTKGIIRYYAKWDGKVQPVQEADFEVIKIKETKPPKRFLVGMYNFWPKKYAEVQDCIKCGMNLFAIRGSSSSLLNLAQQLKKDGYYVMRGAYYWPSGGNEGWKYWTKKDRTARAKDIDGYYIANGNAFQISPSYRGRMMKEAIKKELVFIKKAGINYFSFDMEGYIQPNGEKGDFLERTIVEFKKYFAKNYPTMKYRDPHEFERSPDKNPKYHAAWIKFKAWIWADFFIEMKKEFAVVKDKSCPYPGIIFTEWSFSPPWDEQVVNKSMRGKEWYANAFDFIEISSYSSVDRAVRQFNKTFYDLEEKMPDLDVKFILTPAPVRIEGSYYKTLAPSLNNEFKYCCMEAAGFGFKGINIWYRSLANLDTFRQLSEAIAIINKVDDIIIDGKRIKKISCDQSYITVNEYFNGRLQERTNEPSVFVKGLKLGNKALICVSEYREQTQMKIKVNYTPETDVKIIDLETDQEIGVLKKGEKSFYITLEPVHRCKLFLLKPLN